MNSRPLLLALAALAIVSCRTGDDASSKTALPPIPPRPATATGSVVIVGTLESLPADLPANDLYKYAYVMKYTVDTVVEGSFTGKEILVAHYDPRTARSAIEDDQKGLVGGNVASFQSGDRHYLVLAPLDSSWTGAIEDNFPQDHSPRWWASWADRI